MTIFNFNKEEQKIRKNWLISTIALILGLPVLTTFIGYAADPSLEKELIAVLIRSCFQFFILYHCAYKKCGYAWLLGCLTICAPLGILMGIFAPGGSSEDLAIRIVFSSPFYIWWYVTSVKLYKLNKKLAPTIKTSQEYANVIKRDLVNAANLEKLDGAYKSILKKWPHFEKVTQDEYNKRKAELTC